MREILFRGKKITSGEWVVGNYNQNVINRGFDTIEDLENFPYLHYGVDYNTVGQYTGLTDKNGKRIFEGDIIRAKIEGGNHKGFTWQNMPVDFQQGAFCLNDQNGRVFCVLGAFAPSVSLEVIGNIHDNPELIQEVE
jgi:uncharacterized phage protein (TIGR01671 family)